MSFDDYIKKIIKEDKDLLESLGYDFDEEGIPYWEKWGSESKFDAEFDVDTTLPDAVN